MTKGVRSLNLFQEPKRRKRDSDDKKIWRKRIEGGGDPFKPRAQKVGEFRLSHGKGGCSNERMTLVPESSLGTKMDGSKGGETNPSIITKKEGRTLAVQSPTRGQKKRNAHYSTNHGNFSNLRKKKKKGLLRICHQLNKEV